MKIKNQQEGVTLITVVITIVVVIIIAAIGYVSSSKGLDEAISTKFQQEIAEVKKGVDTKKIINSKNGIEEEIINAGFKKIEVENPPKNFVSFDAGKNTAYLIDLSVIDYTELKTGQEYKDLVSGDKVKFDENDVYIYDKKGTVYYVKGISIEGSEKIYTINSEETEGPNITAENTEGGIINITVIPAKGGEISSVTVDGQIATKKSEGIYEIEVVKNGSYIIVATEEGNGASKTTVNVTKIDEENSKGNTEAPTIANIKINTGEAYTTRQMANLNIETDAEIMCIKHTKDLAEPSIEDAAWRRSTEKSTLYLTEGLNVVHAWFKNKQNDTIIYKTTSIILDTTPPTKTKPDVLIDDYDFEITSKQIDPAVGSGLKKIEIGYRASNESEYHWFEVENILTPKVTIKNNKPDVGYIIKSRAEDNVGHISESTEYITESLSSIPNGVIIEYSPTEGWTTLSTVVITYPEKSLEKSYERWYRLADGEWKEATGRVEKLYLEENIKIDAVVVKKASNETLFGEIKSITIENIDVIEPRLENIKMNLTNIPTNMDFGVTATMIDEESGLFAYAVVNSENQPDKWTPLKDVVSRKEISFGVKVDTPNYIWIKDVAGNISKNYVQVEPKDFTSANVEINLIKDNYDYNGKEIMPEIEAKDKEENVVLKKDEHYTITYENNIEAGTASAIVVGKKAYTGTKTINFKIVPVIPTITLENTSYIYDRETKKIKDAVVTGTTYGKAPTGTITYTYYKESELENKTTTADGASKEGEAPNKVGTYYVIAQIAADGNYLEATSNMAVLTIQPHPVEITYNANGGTPNYQIKTVEWDEPYGTLPTVTNGDREFNGWFTELEGQGDLITETTIVTQKDKHILYACWNRPPKITNVTITDRTTTSMTISALATDPDEDEIRYRFYHNGNLVHETGYVAQNVTQTYTVTGLKEDTRYSYKVIVDDRYEYIDSETKYAYTNCSGGGYTDSTYCSGTESRYGTCTECSDGYYTWTCPGGEANVTCRSCAGNGTVVRTCSGPSPCSNCGGSGKNPCAYENGYIEKISSETSRCTRCGTGTLTSEVWKCRTCGLAGSIVYCSTYYDNDGDGKDETLCYKAMTDGFHDICPSCKGEDTSKCEHDKTSSHTDTYDCFSCRGNGKRDYECKHGSISQHEQKDPCSCCGGTRNCYEERTPCDEHNNSGSHYICETHDYDGSSSEHCKHGYNSEHITVNI